MEFVTDILDAQDAFALGFFLTCWIGYVLYSVWLIAFGVVLLVRAPRAVAVAS